MCLDDEWYDEFRERLNIVLERSYVDRYKYSSSEDSYYNPDA